MYAQEQGKVFKICYSKWLESKESLFPWWHIKIKSKVPSERKQCTTLLNSVEDTSDRKPMLRVHACQAPRTPYGVLTSSSVLCQVSLQNQDWNKSIFSEREESGSSGTSHAKDLERTHLDLTVTSRVPTSCCCCVKHLRVVVLILTAMLKDLHWTGSALLENTWPRYTKR